MSRRLLLSSAIVGALVLVGCGAAGPNADGGGVEVVATTTVVGDLARAVGGDAADVTQLLQPNTDAHEYEPRPDDVGAATGAALVLQSGDELDRWAADLVEQSGTDAPLVDLAEKLRVRRPGETQGDEASRYDPLLGTIRPTSSPPSRRSATPSRRLTPRGRRSTPRTQPPTS